MIGYGGFATVWAAARDRDGLPVAIKVARGVQPNDRTRLLAEGDALRAIGPPYVPAVHDTGALEDGAAFLVMELLATPTLADQLGELAAGMPPAQFAAPALAVVAALEAVHAHGFVHLDLKPENICLGPSPGDAKLIDFGIARQLSTRASATEGAVTGVVGSPEYMSPEQAEGRAETGVASDIYSVGVVFYEMLAARTPFFGSAADVRQAHCERRPQPPSELVAISPALEATVLRCLAKDPRSRFETVDALGDALASAVAEPGSVKRTPRPAAPRSSPKTARERRPVALLYFSSRSEVPRIQAALHAFDGQIGHVAAEGYVAVFEPRDGSPVRRAVRAAEKLIETQVCACVVVEVAPIVIQVSAGGTRRYTGAALLHRESFPRDSDPPGVLLGDKAVEALPEVATTTEPCRAGLVQAEPPSAELHSTFVSSAGSELAIGREDMVRSLLASARLAVEQRIPTIATIIGDVGHGKTHLCAGLRAALGVFYPPIEIWEIRAREPLVGDTDETLRAILRRALDLPLEPPADRGRALVAERLGGAFGNEGWAAVAVTLGWATPDDPAIRGIAAAPGALRSAVSYVVGHGLRRVAATRPLCLLLDDAHHADGATLDALEYAALAEHGAPLWICVTALPSFGRARPHWSRRAARREAQRLDPLDAEAAAIMCRRLLAPVENPPTEAVARLVQRTQGVPLLLAELVRGLKREGLVRQHAAGAAWYLATDELEGMPDLPYVDWVAHREIDRLPAELLAHARLVALLGSELVPSEVEGVIRELERAGLGSAFPLDARVGLQRLREHGLVIVRRRGRVSFRNGMVRDVVNRSTPAEQRRAVHQAAFRYYADPSAGPEAERLPQLAYHAEQSEQRQEAAALYLMLAERARFRHAYLDAEMMYSRALGLVAEGDVEPLLVAHKGRGIMRYRLGRYEDAIEDLDLAAESAQRSSTTDAEVEVLLEAATIRDWMGDPARSRDLVDRALALSGPHPSPIVEAGLLMARARSIFRFGEWEKAAEIYDQAVARAERLGDLGYETLIASLVLLGPILATLGRIEEAERVFDRAMALCKEHGDPLHLGVVIHNRQLLWQVRRDGRRATEDIRQFLQLGREMGLLDVEFRAEYNLADVTFQCGDLDTATSHAARAIELAELIGGESSPQRPAAVLLEARLLVFRGDLEPARAIVARLNETTPSLVPNDAMFARLIDLATRNATDAEWDALEALAGQVGTQQDPIEVIEIRGLSARRQGRLDDARRILERARHLSTELPNLMGPRLQRDLDDLGPA